MATGKQIIAKAKTYLGQGGAKFNRAYYGSDKYDDWAWCAVFVWYIFKECNASNLWYGGNKTAYVPDAQAWCKKNLKAVSVSEAKKGDVVIFDWNGNKFGDHIGFAIAPLSGSVLETIEGNTSGSIVAIRKRDKSTIIGIYRPKYSSDDDTIKIDRTYIVSAKKAVVRRGAGAKYAIVDELKNGDEIKATKMSKDKKWIWKSTGKTGWIELVSLRLKPSDAVVTINRTYQVIAQNGTDIRRGASKRYKIVGHLKKGQKIHGAKMNDKWVWTSDSPTGWIEKKDLKLL